ncbi:mannose-1-phosphate guanylyltransferase/mannose-6-phosphate isomerase [bacterium]|nr:MAG: mannose-1-phosphate guanylyltransferase/mannose-6-phosphate isomerase [bacterium]
MLHPVILCGGSGTRLWPLSRQALPKQFLPLLSNQSLLQEAVIRLRGLSDLAPPLVVCNNEHRFLVADQLLELGGAVGPILLEPAGRNTAPAVALAAFTALQSDPDALLLVLPSDHVIRDANSFRARVDDARALAQDGYLVTFGIVPTTPETGYGYIERGEVLDGNGFDVKRFVEKPDTARAKEFVEAGTFFWNSGMFLLPAQMFLAELHQHAPEIYEAVKLSYEGAATDLDFCRPDQEAFLSSPSVSIDYAVMEHTTRAAVVPSSFEWSDVGSYTALWEIENKDENGNAVQGEVAVHDAKGCYVRTEKQLVALLGVEDLVVVATADAILVASKERSQDVKLVVDELKRQGRAEHEVHKKVYRPWGWYEGVERGDRFQVKQLMVKPGQKSSMQVHHHRSEHWIIVKGTAKVTLGEEERLLTEDESIYIPLGVPHRIFNPGRIPMHFVEVQSGSYLEEDDIVRIDDQYGRG